MMIRWGNEDKNQVEVNPPTLINLDYLNIRSSKIKFSPLFQFSIRL